MKKRRALLLGLAGLLLVPAGWFGWAWATYPTDRTPEGAYLRVMSAVNRGRPEEFFWYTETAAQHASYTILRFRKQARDHVLASYPEPERSKLAETYAAEARGPDGADLFALLAREYGWLDRLRRDMSAVRKVEIEGERATVETVRGTRYPFRLRDNGMWGLTLFTPVLVARAERAVRDAERVARAAVDYERERATP